MAKLTRNRLNNTFNEYQGKHKKVLCVCSAGVLRSPTAAAILSSPPYNFNTRAVGTSEEYALIPIDLAHVAWADCFICFDKSQEDRIRAMQSELKESYGSSHYLLRDEMKSVYNLEIDDEYNYRDPELVDRLERHFNVLFGASYD
jgi:predicted protein tyrosine phosphatase